MIASDSIESKNQKLQLLLDVGPAVHQRAGLAKYAERLANELLKLQSESFDLTLFYNAHSNHQLAQPLCSAPQISLAMGQYQWRLSVLASQLLRTSYRPVMTQLDKQTRLRRELSRTEQGNKESITDHLVIPSFCQLYHATEHLLPCLPCPTVLTVHDLIFERFPQHHTFTNRLFLKFGMPLFVRAATAIIAVSQHTKRDLVELYRTPAEKIHVIHEGIDERFRPASRDELQRVKVHYSPDRPYLLMVGTLEPRKNHAAALRALARLKQQGFAHRLLIVGGQGWLFEPIKKLVDELELTGDVTFAGYIPLDDLPPLYTGSDCVLLPSLYEGFGFPVLEAMACAAPVVCSSASSLPEVAGEAALLVDPQDDAGLAATVSRVLAGDGVAAGLRERGKVQAGKFTWAECARQTVEVYRSIRTVAKARFRSK